MAQPLAVDLRAAICDAVRAGASVRAAATQFGVSVGVVAKITRGLSRDRETRKKPRDFARDRRLALLNRGFVRASELLEAVTTVQQLQTWAVAVGVLIDKRRLEEGEVTARTEMVTDDRARAELARRLDELAARRAQRATMEMRSA